MKSDGGRCLGVVASMLVMYVCALSMSPHRESFFFKIARRRNVFRSFDALNRDVVGTHGGALGGTRNTLFTKRALGDLPNISAENSSPWV